MSIPSRSSFPPAVYAERIRKTLFSCRQQGLAGIVIATGPELAYFTGSWTRSHERLTALVISARGDVVFIAPATDSAQLAGVDAIGGIVIDTWRDGEDPYALVAAHLGSGPVALGSSLTADHVLRLQEAVGEIVLSGDVLDVFTVKEPQELEQLEHAATAIDTVHEHVPALLRPGRTEAEVAAELSELIGASHDKVDFIIVGSGPNGANPHHTHTRTACWPRGIPWWWTSGVQSVLVITLIARGPMSLVTAAMPHFGRPTTCFGAHRRQL